MNEMRFREGAAVRALEGKRLEVLAAPYGSPGDRDHLNEYFSARTDFMLDVGDRRPALYFHGFTSEKKMQKKPAAIGIATAARTDEAGLWMEVTLKDSPLADRLYKAAEAGTCRASTGAVNYLCRTSPDGEVEVWPIGELSLIDEGPGRHPANDKAIAVPLKALFAELDLDVPEAFGAMENGEDAVPASKSSTVPKGGTTMATELELAVKAELDARETAAKAEEAKVAAMRASILEELKGEPEHRSLFAIGGKVTGETSKFAFRSTPEERAKYDKAELEDTSRFLYHLMRPLQAPAAMRVLEETEAAEGAGLIPAPFLDRIIAMRDETSLVAKLGLTRLQTNSLTLRIPREDAAMAVFAAIAEEGAYIANEPAFSAETVTVAKRGSMITVTEEMLEDSSLFEPYFAGLCGRKWGLTENLLLFTELKADDTIGTHSATFTQAEIDAFMFQITEPWADGAHLICAQATMGVIRGLLVATPRAYGDFPNFGGLAYPSLFGYPFHLNSNWEAIGAGDTTLTMTLVNPAAMAWVERRGLVIKVDPYGDSLNGRVRYFPSFRAQCATTQVLGNVSYTDHA